MAKHFLFRGGVHPNEAKITREKPIQTAPLFERYVIPVQQHIGAPAKILVKKNDEVLRGQLIAEAGGFVSAPVHASISGKVNNIIDCLVPNGSKVKAIEIISDGEDKEAPRMATITNWKTCLPEILKKRVAEAGLVGMGGATFPTMVKLSPPPDKKIDVLIINAVECEPCLTADHRQMLEEPQKVLNGIAIVARILGAKQIYIGIENNKPDAIKLLTEKAKNTDIKVMGLRVRYPQGAEKQLIYAITKRKVPAGGLPMDVGCVVQNVGTVAAIAEAVIEGKPLYERVTTITGSPVVNPGNWRLRIGTSFADALTLAGGVKSDPAKLISGGPMMGMSVYSLEIPVMKGSSGILLLAPEEISQYSSQACLRCGKCLDVCPMSLRPGTLSVLIENEVYDEAEQLHCMDCIECGCCAYACPAQRPLVQHFKRAKGEIIARRRARG